MAVKIQFRRGTSSQWSSANPTLDAGEVGVETDSGRFKVGDGTTAWNSLAYALSPVAYTSVNTQAGTTYTFTSGDETKITSSTSSSAATFTVPPNSSEAFAIGSRLDVLQKGVGQVTVAAGAGVTINTPTTLKTRDQYSIVAVIKVDTDEWIATGDLAVI